MTGRQALPQVPIGRRSHDSRPSSPIHNTRPERRRTSSDATPTTPKAPEQPVPAYPDPPQPANTTGTSRRLGFLGDILSSSASLTGHKEKEKEKELVGSAVASAIRTGTPIPSQLLPPRTHSRADSVLSFSIPRDSSASPVPPPMASSSSSPATIGIKSHTSPSKPSSGRTYDSKLVSREMHRLGNLAHLPSVVAAAASATSLALPGSAPAISAPSIMASLSSSDNPWAQLHVHVLPLFNGEPLRIPIEDLNALVKKHVQTVISASPSRAVSTLEHDAAELISAGMVTFNAKLVGIEDEQLVRRVVERWVFFWDQVLPYVEGALLPLQTDPLLLSLYRAPKGHRTSSPTRSGNPKSSSSLSSSAQIDVRTVALRSFRDKVILPLFPRLDARLEIMKKEMKDGLFGGGAPENQIMPRLQQMLLVLASQTRQRPTPLSLTEPAPQPTAGDVAITQLLRTIRSPLSSLPTNGRLRPFSVASAAVHKRTPSFLSGQVPRDRRGRIGQKPGWLKAEKILGGDDGMACSSLRRIIFYMVTHTDLEDDENGEETPRNFGYFERGREKEREFLDSLRSPDPEGANARASLGGWGLGGGGTEEPEQAKEEDEEEDTMDWDQAQAVVERMVGMKPNEVQAPEMRRRMT
ncbi:HbrB-domain-containing protein [Heliocybe sulcata]|uniref:HbrB-domain-containing protein n=1 Tax=Heliocybe sulcata TaxID=5364 RepID=A0A5C3N867_9AGAM|nr:HbrB-domain-containing protein [Heliocybe sulcata]